MWKKAFKKCEVIWSAKGCLSSTHFTSSIVEYFDPFVTRKLKRWCPLFYLYRAYIFAWETCFSLVNVLFNEIQSRTLTFQKNLCYLLHWKPFKNDEKCFSFHFKSSFRSQNIEVFLMTFCACKKTAWLER